MFQVRKKINNKEIRSYFFIAFNLKMIGAIMLSFIFFYYYGYGDTLLYHELSNYLYNAFFNHTEAWFNLVFLPIGDYGWPTNMYIAGNVFYLRPDPSTYFVIRIAGFLSIFCDDSYLVLSLFFGVISFFGAWAMFIAFTDMYPRLVKQFAISIFYLPSIFFWGSGLMKDSLCFGALGLAFYGYYFAVIKRQKIAKNALIGLLGMWVLYQVKIYIILAFIPMLAIWTYLQYINNIKSKFLRFFIAPIILASVGIVGIYAVIRLSVGTDYNIDNLAKKSQVTATYLQNMSQQGSVYYIGEFDGTITGLFKYFPQAVAVTLYRPFLWEAKNPFSLLAALEATYFIFFTFYVIFIKVKLKNIIATFTREPVAPASLFFAVFFSFSVGITAGNFGTLVRYKIPMMPFYMAALMIMIDSNRKKSVAELSIELMQKRQQELLDARNNEDATEEIMQQDTGFITK